MSSGWTGISLPFGLRSAPLIFTPVADALQWIMKRMGVEWVAHYIDDFITLGAADSTESEHNATIMHEACARVGLPVGPEKDEGPTTALSFVGIELDSNGDGNPSPTGEAQTPKESPFRLEGEKIWQEDRITLSDRTPLPRVQRVRAGRSFLRRLINLSMVPKHLDHYVRLSKEARSDIEWWAQ